MNNKLNVGCDKKRVTQSQEILVIHLKQSSCLVSHKPKDLTAHMYYQSTKTFIIKIYKTINQNNTLLIQKQHLVHNDQSYFTVKKL